MLSCLPPVLLDVVAVAVSKLLFPPFELLVPVVIDNEEDDGDELMGGADAAAGEVDIDELALFDSTLVDGGEENFDEIESISEGTWELEIAVELDDDNDGDVDDADEDGLSSFFDEDRNEKVPEGVVFCIKKLLI